MNMAQKVIEFLPFCNRLVLAPEYAGLAFPSLNILFQSFYGFNIGLLGFFQ